MDPIKAAADSLRAARAAGLRIIEPGAPEQRRVQVNGLSISYLDWGNAHLPHLLLVHGFAQQSHSWDFTALALRHRFHILALDLRGHGDSAHAPDGDYSLDSYLGDMESFVDALELRGVVLCGLSLGGHISYMYAARRPECVRALALVEAAPETCNQGNESISRFTAGATEFSSFDDMVQRVMAYSPHRTEEQVRGALVYSVKLLPGGSWTWKYDPRIRDARLSGYPRQALWDAIAAISCPTLFVTGAESDMITGGTVDRMVSAVRGSTSVVVPRAGHRVPGDNPAGFLAVFSRFADSLPVRVDGGIPHED
ncbi:MAG: alpha/beta hydrolase [Dehalococcoidia bacterium]